MSGLIYLGKDFYLRDVREVAPALVGKLLIREFIPYDSYRVTEQKASEKFTNEAAAGSTCEGHTDLFQIKVTESPDKKFPENLPTNCKRGHPAEVAAGSTCEGHTDLFQTKVTESPDKKFSAKFTNEAAAGSTCEGHTDLFQIKVTESPDKKFPENLPTNCKRGHPAEVAAGSTRLRITETEAYCGVSDTACHAFRGKTARNQLLWCEGGTIYVYLCYGIHHMLNIITGNEGDPQGVLIRACEGYAGPGRLTRKLQIDKSLNGESIIDNPRLAIADDGTPCRIRTDRRVGIDYASPADRAAQLRFIAEF